MLEDQSRLVLEVVDGTGLRMGLAKLLHPCFEVRPGITEDFSRHPRSGHGLGQLLIDYLPSGLLHWIQGDGLHILRPQAAPTGR
jgi:hypothetical protein